MYKVIESWRHIDRRRFTEMFRWLLRAGHVGSIGTFNAYKGSVTVTGQTYYALVDKVCRRVKASVGGACEYPLCHTVWFCRKFRLWCTTLFSGFLWSVHSSKATWLRPR